jgi:hypothetical protein
MDKIKQKAEGCIVRRSLNNTIVVSAKCKKKKIEIHFVPEEFALAITGQVCDCVLVETEY